jgi:hypothetical protein
MTIRRVVSKVVFFNERRYVKRKRKTNRNQYKGAANIKETATLTKDEPTTTKRNTNNPLLLVSNNNNNNNSLKLVPSIQIIHYNL